MMIPGIAGLSIVEPTRRSGEGTCALCDGPLVVAKVQRAGDAPRTFYGEACVKCKLVAQVIPCPFRVEAAGGPASPTVVAQWLRHLKEDHGWTESDIDPIWRSRARAGRGAEGQ